MRCQADGSTACDARKDAQRAGEMYYAPHLRGWVWTQQGRHHAGVPRVVARPHTWPFCPFCLGDLPTEVDVVARIVKRPPETWGEGPE